MYESEGPSHGTVGSWWRLAQIPGLAYVLMAQKAVSWEKERCFDGTSVLQIACGLPSQCWAHPWAFSGDLEEEPDSRRQECPVAVGYRATELYLDTFSFFKEAQPFLANLAVLKVVIITTTKKNNNNYMTTCMVLLFIINQANMLFHCGIILL